MSNARQESTLLAPTQQGDTGEVLEIVYGHSRPDAITQQLVKELQHLNAEGTIYLAYPVMGGFDERLIFDAFVMTKAQVPVILMIPDDVPEGSDVESWNEVADRLYDAQAAVKSKLLSAKELRQRGQLRFDPVAFLFVPRGTSHPNDMADIVVEAGGLSSAFAQVPPLPRDCYRPLAAAIQSVSTIKPQKKRAEIVNPKSYGSVIKAIERKIANLDKWQQGAAIESPDKPQRIRGLAGSGKTIVLALKAAYLHARHPDWTIAVTFQTRSLYPQFRDLIRRFVFDQTRDEPDWNRLRVLHSWGSLRDPGVYSTLAQRSGAVVLDVGAAKRQFGYEGMFAGICKQLTEHLRTVDDPALFDAVLIDEAQDLPPEFFELCYAATRKPKRIVWAFDELQNLTDDASMPGPERLFGSDETGAPCVPTLENADGMPKQDIFLPVCYRNPPQILAVAHSLGLGVYRDGGLIQFFGDGPIWEQFGYRIDRGGFTPSETVAISRQADSYPEFFTELLNTDDVVQCHSFSSEQEQWDWIAKEIQRNLNHDELEPDDIVVVFPDPKTVNRRAPALRSVLENEGITAQIAGVTTTPDEFSQSGSVTLAGIYRAKGNEAPMVYVVDCHTCFDGVELIRKRNALFSAITRARAWVRILGVGAKMDGLIAEIEAVVNASYRLEFEVPNPAERKRLRQVHRDLTQQEKQRTKAVSDALSSIAKNEVPLEHLSPELIKALREKLRSQ